MIASFELASAPCFGDRPVTIGPLNQVNFVFGANGSGKTTISRALADTLRSGSAITWDPAGFPLGIRVYNRDYVAKTVADADRLAGVFLLGAGGQDVRKEIEELDGPAGTIATLQQNLLGLQSTLGDEVQGTGKLGEIRATRTRLTEAAWAKRGDMPATLEPMFGGTKGSKAKFLQKLLDLAGKYPSDDANVQSLVREASSIFDDTATEIDELPAVIEPEPEQIDGFDLLDTAIVGSSDVALAALIEELQNSDWVSQGRTYFDHADGRCPFCQQQAPRDLPEQLRKYFDSRFAEQVALLGTFVERHDGETQKLREALDAIEERSATQLDAATFATVRTDLETTLSANSRELAEKQQHPSTTVKLEPVSDDVAAVNTVIEAANVLIREHNSRVRNRAAANQALVEKCWRYFVRSTNAAEIAVYETVMPGLEAAKKSLEDKIAQTAEKVHAAERRRRSLEREIRSSKPIIEEINKTLASVGFESFRLAASPDLIDGYSLVRPGGKPVAESLSEGERTFVTFLYFFHQLLGEPDDANEPRDLVAVIDDPISSLDSDILFVVSSLTKRLIAGIRTGTGRVRQLVVLTHNVYFHKEVTYARTRIGESDGGRAFFVLRKRAGQPSELIAHAENPVKTAYRSLWDEVRTATEEPPLTPTALQNVMRRIIENYFRIMGDIDENEIVAMFSGGDQAVCRSLFSWAHEGSHTIIEELDYSPTEVSTEAFLRVFEAIFDHAGHAAHYTMMMRPTI